MLGILGTLRRLLGPAARSLLRSSDAAPPQLPDSQSDIERSMQEPHIPTAPTTGTVQPSLVLSKEPLQLDALTKALVLFTTGYSRAFTLNEFIDWLHAEVDQKALRQTLTDDLRFICLRAQENDEEYFIAETTLFRWWGYLNLRLARAHRANLSQQQLALAMSSIRLDGQWTAVPERAMDFGRQFGFVGAGWPPEQYVFPLAHVLSTLPPWSIEPAHAVLETFAFVEKRNSVLTQSLAEAIELGLSQFDERTVRVVKARERLQTGAKMTLQQIGAVEGLTRERVRQIEAKFWEQVLGKSNKRPSRDTQKRRTAFLSPFLAEFMRRHGSLVVNRDSEDGSRFRLLIKCVGIPQIELPFGGLLVIGAVEANFPKLVRPDLFVEIFDHAAIANHLHSSGCFYLLASDLICVAEAFSNHKFETLNKTQKAYHSLQHLGRPAHYSKVTEVYNQLFPDDSMTAHNIHAVLSRCASPDIEQHGIVWIGVRGTYALKEWGYERPSKGLFDAVTEIVQRKYGETGMRPVPFTVITAEIGKYRQVVNPTSLMFATHCNPRLKRVLKDSFVPGQSGDRAQDHMTDDELDRILKEFGKAENRC